MDKFYIVVRKNLQGRLEICLKQNSQQEKGLKLFTVENKVVTDSMNPAESPAFPLPAGKSMVGLEDALISAAKTYLGAS